MIRLIGPKLLVKNIYAIYCPSGTSGSQELIGKIVADSGNSEEGVKVGDYILYGSYLGKLVSYKDNPYLLIEDCDRFLIITDLFNFMKEQEEKGLRFNKIDQLN